MTQPEEKGVLDGVRILDLTRYEAGPTCTLYLAFLGAEVIKIEQVQGGKSDRQLFYDEAGAKEDLYFVLLNLNKKSITLDVCTDRGRDLFLGLIKRSDVVVENFRPETMKRWRLDYPVLSRENPRLIYASVTGYGSYGLYSSYPGMDMTAQAMGGLMSITGEADDPPLRCGAAVADSAGGANLAMGILGALYRREKTGRGMAVEVSLQDSAVSLGRSILGTHIAYGSRAHKAGNSLKDVVPWNIYPSRDGGWVAICAIHQRLFRKLLRVMGEEEMIEALPLHTLQDRKRARKTVENAIGRWVSARTKREVMEELCKNGIPCGAVLDSLEIGEDPHLMERKMVVEIEHHQWGRIKALGCPIKFSETPTRMAGSPKLGEHNKEILCDLLGLEDEKLDALKKEGII